MVERSPRPAFEAGEAPGHKVRWTGKIWEVRWVCRSDIVKLGFKPKVYHLWFGNVELTKIDRNFIADRCRKLQDEMLVFARGGLQPVTTFDGTIKDLARRYMTDPDSEYHKLRYRSKINYANTIMRIVKRHGDCEVRNLNARTIKGWHRAWTWGEEWKDFDNPPSVLGEHIPMGHSFITHIRLLLSFGGAILEDDDCLRVRNAMREINFPQGAPRKQILTAKQVDAIRRKAHDMGWHSLALAQAIQFEGTLRQRDCIGEWCPIETPGISDVTWDGAKWLRGIRWEEINQNFVLTHVTSKKNKEVVIDLRLAPMVMDELRFMAQVEPDAALTRDLFPASGALVRREHVNRPWSADDYRKRWREVADAAGIPKEVRSMDSRAGAITEGAAVADLDDVRHAATHAQLSQTANYSRDAAKRTAKVMKLRAENRKRTTD